MLTKLMMIKKFLAAAFCAGAVIGFLIGAYSSDHSLTQSVSELIRVKHMISEELNGQ